MIKLLKMYKPFIFGAIAAVPEISFTHWIDVMKITQQDIHQNTRKQLKIKQVAKYIYRNNNIKGFYKGYVPRVIGCIPMRFFFWGIQDTSAKILPIQNKLTKLIISGVLGGAGQTIIDTPIEVAKIQSITSPVPIKPFAPSTLRAAIPSFLPNLYRNCVFSGTFCIIAKMLTNDDSTKIEKLLYGMIGGGTAAFISHPLDVVKTDLQRARKNGIVVNKTTCKLLKEYIKRDITLLYSGLGLRMFHTSGTMGVGFLAISMLYEYF